MSVQGHIHLDLELGDAPENAPPMKWLVITDGRAEITNVFGTFQRAIDGTPRPHVLLSGATPFKPVDFRYRLLLLSDDQGTTAERKALLQSYLGRTVYLVDNDHIGNGQDHTPYVRAMHFQQMSEPQTPDIGLRYYLVDIELMSLETP